MSHNHHDAVTAAYNFGVTIVGAVVSISVQALPVVQLIAGIIACVTGVFAIRYYIRSTKGK